MPKFKVVNPDAPEEIDFYQDIPFMYHVGPDSHNCYPVCFEQIIVDIKNKVNECYAML